MIYFIRRAKLSLILIALSSGISLNGQTAKDAGIDVHFHKFQPRVAPEAAIQSQASESQFVNGMSVAAANQIRALQQEKAARTPAQQKIDSNILYTSRMLVRRCPHA
jgi:hypothetical protein